MRKIILSGSLVLLLAGALWWWLRPNHPAPVNASIYETDMMEALVRGVLPEFQPSPAVCFLAFGEGTTPPSSTFIARFAGTQPVVRSCDHAAMPPVGRQFEISTGKPGCLIHVIQFREITPDAFDVLVRFSHLPEGHDQFGYRVTKFAGDWSIADRKPM